MFCDLVTLATEAQLTPHVLQGAKYEYGTARLENREQILADIERVKPTHVMNCAGITGRPNVDWCEDHQVCHHFSDSAVAPWRAALLLHTFVLL